MMTKKHFFLVFIFLVGMWSFSNAIFANPIAPSQASINIVGHSCGQEMCIGSEVTIQLNI